MAYSRSEQETVLVFEAETNEWSVYSTVPKHIRKIIEIAEVTEFLEMDANDNPAAIRATLSAKQVTMKKERVLTDEQRQEMSERMRVLAEKRNEESK